MTDPVCRFTLSTPPPSTNNMYRGRRYKTSYYEAWAEDAGWQVKAQRPSRVAGRLRVRIEVPFKLNRDIENLKPLLDLAQRMGLIENDNRVDEMLIVRVAPDRPTLVEIWPIDNGAR
jgi:Holliday junction resolvase RusA-like endonuclease